MLFFYCLPVLESPKPILFINARWNIYLIYLLISEYLKYIGMWDSCTYKIKLCFSC